MQRGLSIAVTAAIMAVAACAPEPPPAPSQVVLPSDFETTIARLEAQDPGSPEALNARLQYAERQLSKVLQQAHAHV